MRILFVFGTRPEAVKLCPLVRECRTHPDRFQTQVCTTAQHRELLDTVLAHFDVRPDHDLDIMRPGQSLNGITARVLEGIEPWLQVQRPDVVVVQGDTTTTFAAALAAFHHRIPVAHVEAGLRTGDLNHPFPEELNRVLTTRLTSLHLAPTERARQNLLNEGVPERAVAVTGNTGIDALLYTASMLERGERAGFRAVARTPGTHLVLLTAHRRESFGPGFESICRAVRRLAGRGDTQIIYPVHPNQNVREVVYRALAGCEGVFLIDPQEYVEFVDLMRQADLILTDSGGVQEEAPSFGKPVLVLREKTERQEAVEAGTAILTGTDEERIVEDASKLLNRQSPNSPVTSERNPFGDGHSSERISKLIYSFFST